MRYEFVEFRRVCYYFIIQSRSKHENSRKNILLYIAKENITTNEQYTVLQAGIQIIIHQLV